MSMYFSRNVVIPVWFAIFALATLFVLPSTFVFSLFLLVIGLAVPTIAYMLWPAPAFQPVIGLPIIDAELHEVDGKR